MWYSLWESVVFFPLKVNVVFNYIGYLLTFVSMTGLIVEHCRDTLDCFVSGASI